MSQKKLGRVKLFECCGTPLFNISVAPWRDSVVAVLHAVDAQLLLVIIII